MKDTNLKSRCMLLNDVDSLQKIRAVGGIIYPSWMAGIKESKGGDMPPLLVAVTSKPADKNRCARKHSNVPYILLNGEMINVLKETDHVKLS